MPNLRIANAVTLVERDHRSLVGHWQTLTTALEHSADRGMVRECIQGLISCARAHFRNEEWAMRALSFTDYSEHRSDHKRLLMIAEDMLQNFDGAYENEDWPALSTFFRHWFTRHNEEYDKTLHIFVRQVRAMA